MARDRPRRWREVARADARRRGHPGAARSVRARLWLRQQRLCRVQGVREPQGEGLPRWRAQTHPTSRDARKTARETAVARAHETHTRPQAMAAPGLKDRIGGVGNQFALTNVLSLVFLAPCQRGAVREGPRLRERTRDLAGAGAVYGPVRGRQLAQVRRPLHQRRRLPVGRCACGHLGHPRFALGPPSRHSRVGGTCASRASHSTSTTSSQP